MELIACFADKIFLRFLPVINAFSNADKNFVFFASRSVPLRLLVLSNN